MIQNKNNVTAFIFQNSDMSRTQANNVWEGLKRGITEIQNGNASTLRFEELYRNAYTLVLHKHGDLLYRGVSNTIVKKLQIVAREVKNTTDNQILTIIVEKWKHHKLTMTMIRDILMYMDKTFCEIKRKKDSYNLGVLKFKELVVMDPNVLGRVRKEILTSIECERNGEKIDDSLVRGCLRMLVDLDSSNNSNELYDIEFEKHFLEETRNFYRNESEIFISENSVPDYLRKIEKRLNEEKQRGDSYIPKYETRISLEKTCEFELIGRYKETLVDHEKSGVKDMFRHKKIEDLNRLYKLLGRIDGKNEYLKNAMYNYIKERGTKIISDEENIRNPQKFVGEVLFLRETFQDIVNLSFVEDKHFQRALKEAFEYFINLDMRAARYLSLFTDSLLRTHCLKMSDSEVYEKLDNVITIFKYLSDKDIFEDFYKQHLAQRLLHQKASSNHHERTMIAKLKTECGHQFTSKLEGMFKDITQSEDINQRWIEHSKTFLNNNNNNNIKGNIELNTKVLTTGFWPFPSQEQCILPINIQQKCEEFRRFYCNTYSGRKLQFDTSKGSAELRVNFLHGIKDLVVHTYQMCVLVLFNDNEILSWKQIKLMTRIDPEILERHVLALAHPKVKVLLKKPNRKELMDSHQFKFNNNYKNQRVRVQIGVLDPKKTTENNKTQELPKNVMEARKNRVEAAIVRIMKARKTLLHAQLVAEVVRQLTSRFQPNPQFIKQRISSLIEREYLRRDENDRKLYHYLA